MSESANRKRQFRCPHCNGLIVIPWDLPPTKGPCPHCGKEITSPDVPVESESPAPRKAPTPMPSPLGKPETKSRPDSSGSFKPSDSAASHADAPVPKPVPAAAPMPSPLDRDVPSPSERRPGDLRTVPVAKAVPTPAEPESVHRLEPEEQETTEPAKNRKDERSEIPELRDRPILEEHRESPPKRTGRLVALLLALLLLALIAAAAIWVARGHLGIGTKPTPKPGDNRDTQLQRERYLKTGWREDARKVLEKFIAARTVEEKAVCSLGGAALLPEMTEFYGTDEIDDTDTPASAFSCYDLEREDRERGLFLMIYDRPPGFELSEFFRPLATMEVQYGVDSPDMLLASFARAENFVREPVRVQAFFKETPDGLKVDWHVFVQTKYKLFRSFLYNPTPGRREVFRLLVSEDVAEGGRGKPGTRTYRLDDPINAGDSARVEVPVDSEIGRILSKVNWRGRKETRPSAKTATLELAWRDEDDPKIEISRFVCWEFLGLGGKEGNAIPAENAAEPAPEEAAPEKVDPEPPAPEQAPREQPAPEQPAVEKPAPAPPVPEQPAIEPPAPEPVSPYQDLPEELRPQ